MACATAARAEGGLYDAAAFRPLAADHRAYRVGDTLTILVHESAAATSRAATETSRSANVDVSVTDLHSVGGGQYSSDNTFDGEGVERRSGELLARVTVTVTDVLPNGDLRVQGEQQIALNTETQRISVEGRLRPQDIESDNTAASSRLADAHIDFKGKGLLSSRQKPGLLGRLFHWLF